MIYVRRNLEIPKLVPQAPNMDSPGLQPGVNRRAAGAEGHSLHRVSCDVDNVICQDALMVCDGLQRRVSLVAQPRHK
jgi:hypothetical protein